MSYSFLFMQANGAQLPELGTLYDAGHLRPVIDKTFRFDQTSSRWRTSSRAAPTARSSSHSTDNCERWCPGCRGSGLMLGVRQHESVLDAFFKDLIGELLVGQGAGELQRPDHHGEDAECLDAGRLRIVGC